MRAIAPRRATHWGSLALLAVALLCPPPGVGAAGQFASPAFAQRWEGDETRAPNFWGPLANARDGQQEPYVLANPCGPSDPTMPRPCDPTPDSARRLVQYFDKGRMELNSGPGRGTTITSGLLVREMITGNVQLGDTSFMQRAPAELSVAGDPDTAFPRYRDLGVGAPVSVTTPVGAQVQSVVGPNGATTATNLPPDPAASVSQTDSVTGRAIPRIFADFRTRMGVDVVGVAISEPFWAMVNIGGVPRLVLIQAFERRVLTYNAANPPAFQVEFGNVGQHYYHWRYGGA